MKRHQVVTQLVGDSEAAALKAARFIVGNGAGAFGYRPSFNVRMRDKQDDKS